jgi:cellulose synthase/poly-beta-1,6-N-acetylglucosamine synthase-like glycosyltransferase
LEAGGYDPLTVTEDLEVVLRMRRLRAAAGKRTLFRLLPEPVLWTLAPESWRDLRRQRIRWQRGLLESLWPNRSCFMNPRLGWYGLTAFPNFVLFEALEPWIQALTYPAVLAGLLTEILDRVQVSLVLAAGLLFSVAVTGVGTWLEESHYSRHHTRKSFVRLLILGLVENLGYRQVNWLWRLEGCFHAAFKTRRSWDGHDRKGQAGSMLKTKDQPPDRRAG